MRTLVVIGNGPSLRDFDFHSLRGADTLGMNAAYRYWDRIEWYPDHYCCLDDQLIETHHEEIQRLVHSGCVRSAFVAGNYLILHPEDADNPRITVLDEFSRHWAERRGKSFGRDFVSHPAFQSSDTRKVTTGAYAVRYGAFLGYRRLALIGIDLRYVELLPEAKLQQEGGIALEITATPDKNPNYFFDDYQRAGDRYNVPNPAQHDFDLNPQSFEVLARDFESLPVLIVNCNPGSELERRKIFPLKTLKEAIHAPDLGAVVVPTHKGEKDQILASLALWDKPPCRPFVVPPDCPPKLVIVFNNSSGKEIAAEIETAFQGSKTLETMFSGIEFRYLDLSGEKDSYIRDYKVGSGEHGYKSGPNHQFFETMRLVSDCGPYIYLMETDCAPLGPNWLGHLSEAVSGAEPFWIKGSAYRGDTSLSPRFARHLNGSAIYAVGDPSFQSFISEHWEPALLAMVATEDRRLAYDCGLETLFTASEPTPNSTGWRLWQETAHKFRYTGLLQNRSAAVDLDADPSELAETGAQNGCVVLHNARVTRYMEGLEQPAARSKKPKKNSAPPDDLHFVSTIMHGAVQKDGAVYNLSPGKDNWIAAHFVGQIRQGHEVRAAWEITLEAPANFVISLYRHGDTVAERSFIEQSLEEGSNKVRLSHVFEHDHEGLRLQLHVVDGPAKVGISVPKIAVRQKPSRFWSWQRNGSNRSLSR